MSTTLAETHSIYEIDLELEHLTDEIQEASELGPVPMALQERFLAFCEAFGEKVDRIGRFLTAQEAKADFARKEAQRLSDRARSAEMKVRSTKEMVLYFMGAHETRKLEGHTLTLLSQNNSQDTLRVDDPEALPITYRKVRLTVDGSLFSQILKPLAEEQRRMVFQSVDEYTASTDAVHAALDRGEVLPGVRRYRGKHIRIA
jgi:hypothetical protein